MFKKIRTTFGKLFPWREPIAPPVNREERRARASIARRQAKRKGLRNAESR